MQGASETGGTIMASIPLFGSLKNVLFVDAATCVACGALMAFGAVPVAAATAIPAALLFYAGLSLFPIAAFMAFAGARVERMPVLAWLAAGGNALWVAASFGLLIGRAVVPNLLGEVFVIGQAAVVAALALLEMKGARAMALRAA
jgi:hypothetical protein